MSRPDFIFMLTRGDRTVPDAADRLAEVLASGVRQIGFKDAGANPQKLAELTAAIRAAGAMSYLEVVSLDGASEARSAHMAVELGVDFLLGGTRPEIVLPILARTGIRYYPFAGRIAGHPSQLLGTVEEIVESAKRLARLDGVNGVDLLAYRFDGDVSRLIREVCAAVVKAVIVAGSIDRADRISVAVQNGAAAFTVGTAALDGTFPAASAALPEQIAFIRSLLPATQAGF